MDGILCNTKDELYNEMIKAIHEMMHDDSEHAEFYKEVMQLPKDELLEMFKDTYEEV